MSKKEVSEDLLNYGIGADIDEELDDEDFGNEVIDDDDGEEILEVAEEETAEEEVEEEEAEEEEQAEETSEEPAETADDPTPAQEEKPAKAQKDNRMVPRDRLNQEISKRKALEKQLEQLQTQKSVEKEQPLTVQTLDKAKLKAALEQTLDGKTDDAVEVLAEVMTALQGSGPKKQELTPEQISAAVETALENKALSTKAAEIVEAYSFLDDTNEAEFDEDAAEEVITMRDLYIRRGMRPVDALEKAVKRVAVEFGYAEAEPAAEAPPAKKELKPKPADIAKKMELAKKAPTRIPKSTSPKTDGEKAVADLTDDEFDKLSSQALARARGDIV
jgi:hypothetical protein